MPFHLYINSYEVVTFAAALVMLAVAWRKKSGWLVVLCVPALYLSVDSLSQFMTYDENYIVNETLQVHEGELPPQYILLRSRTSNVILSGIFAVLDRLDVSFTQQRMLLKCLHWLLALGGLLWVIVLGEKIIGEWLALPLFYGLLLLPMNLLAIKSYTPDGLAIMLGMVSCLLLYLTVRDQTDRYVRFNIIIATLAAQQKFILNPVLMLVLVAFVYFRTVDSKNLKGDVLKFTLNGIGWSVLVGFISSMLLFAVMRSSLLYLLVLLTTIADHLIGWVWPILFNLGLAGDGGLAPPREIILPMLLVVVAMVYGSVLFLHWGIPRLGGLLAWFKQWGRVINLGLAMVIVLAGLYGHFALNVYLAPPIAVPEGNFTPTSEFNTFVTHFGAKSLPEHLFFSVTYACAMFLTAVPTVLWGVLLWTLWRKTAFGFELLLLVSLLIPLGFGVMMVPAVSRYMNFALFLMATALLFKVGERLQNASLNMKWIVVGGMMVLFVLEIFPFAPLYGGFHPIWLRYDETRRTTATAGHLDPMWWGMGEEMMLAGRKIVEDCDCHDVTLYSSFGSDWMNAPIKTKVFLFSDLKPTELPYTAQDYYVLNRVSVSFGDVEMPPIAPLFTIDADGYVYAWVFRGDDLAQADFRFVWRSLEESQN